MYDLVFSLVIEDFVYFLSLIFCLFFVLNFPATQAENHRFPFWPDMKLQVFSSAGAEHHGDL